jgi:hypothetical protein
MEEFWDEIVSEVMNIKEFNTEDGWVQEDNIEWQYPLMKNGVLTARALRCSNTVSVLSNIDGLKDAGFSLLDYGCIVEPRVTGEGKRVHWVLSDIGYVHDPVTQTWHTVDGKFFIQNGKVIEENEGETYSFMENEPWGHVNMTTDSIIRVWYNFFHCEQ